MNSQLSRAFFCFSTFHSGSDIRPACDSTQGAQTHNRTHNPTAVHRKTLERGRFNIHQTDNAFEDTT
jgi:hypothetical protein